MVGGDPETTEGDYGRGGGRLELKTGKRNEKEYGRSEGVCLN